MSMQKYFEVMTVVQALPDEFRVAYNEGRNGSVPTRTTPAVASTDSTGRVVVGKMEMNRCAAPWTARAQKIGVSLGSTFVGSMLALCLLLPSLPAVAQAPSTSAPLQQQIVEALANGLPVAATTLLVNQLGWIPNEPVLCADGAADFARAVSSLAHDEPLWNRLSKASVDRIETEFSHAKMRQALDEIVGFGAEHSQRQLTER